MFSNAAVGAVGPTLTIQTTTRATFESELNPFLENRSRFTRYPVLGDYRVFFSGLTPYTNHPAIEKDSHVREGFLKSASLESTPLQIRQHILYVSKQ